MAESNGNVTIWVRGAAFWGDLVLMWSPRGCKEFCCNWASTDIAYIGYIGWARTEIPDK